MNQGLRPFSVPLDGELKRDLEQLARMDERKLATYVRKILKDHVQSARATGQLPKRKNQHVTI